MFNQNKGRNAFAGISAQSSVSLNGDYGGNNRIESKARYLSTVMDLSKVESIKTIDTNDYDSKIFVETIGLPD